MDLIDILALVFLIIAFNCFILYFVFEFIDFSPKRKSFKYFVFIQRIGKYYFYYNSITKYVYYFNKKLGFTNTFQKYKGDIDEK